MAQMIDASNARPELQLVREFLGETADAISITCTTLCNFLELKDDAGAHYAVKCLLAYAGALSKAAERLPQPRKD